VAAAVVALACVPSARATIEHNEARMRPDSRLVAREWILRELEPGAKILLDDYGPALNQTPATIARQRAILATLGKGPFTANQSRRLELLARYPPPDGRDIEELGHQWWRSAEVSDRVLRSDRHDLDMGSPLVSRKAKSLDDYRADGIRYVVTNSMARGEYTGRAAERGRRLPSFTRFYGELEALEPIQVFDPATWGGKGPVIEIYDLQAEARSAAVRRAA
jgi:hypothetical protein